MLNFVSSVLLLTLVGVVSPQCITTNDTQPPPPHPDLGHILPFSLGLFKELYVPSSATGNFFFSPFSIWNALILAYFGSAGRTREQLQQVLNLKNPADTLATYKAVDRLYAERQTNTSDIVINLANRMYLNASLPLRVCVRGVLSDKIQLLNFNTVDATATLNQFVANTTHDKIKNLFKESDLLGSVNMVLVNAAYFKGFWLTPFNTQLTVQAKFYTSTNHYSLVEMMVQIAEFNYGKSGELGATVLELPYKGEAASMFVLLPDAAATDNTTTPLDAMLTRLTPFSLRAALATLKRQRVTLRIPKFTLEHEIRDDLQKSLIRLGIRDLFSAYADLSIYDPSGSITAKDTIHKAVVEVNEKGSEAGAATGISIGIRFGGKRFSCDRPFLFFIQDNHTNNILFMGVYRQPSTNTESHTNP